MAVVQDIEEHAPILTVTQARGAARGRHIAWVLGISMALVVAGFTAMYLYHLPHLNASSARSAASSNQAAGFQAPPPQPRQSENRQTTPGVGSDGRGL